MDNKNNADKVSELESRVERLEQALRNLGKIPYFAEHMPDFASVSTQGIKLDPINWMTIQFKDRNKRSQAYECLLKNCFLYERLLYSCANVQEGGLEVLRQNGFEFEEVNYSDWLDRGPKGQQLRENYLRVQREFYGYSLD